MEKFIYSAINDNEILSICFYGMTRDPESSNYMVILLEMKLGSLRSNLMIKIYNPNDKYEKS